MDAVGRGQQGFHVSGASGAAGEVAHLGGEPVVLRLAADAQAAGIVGERLALAQQARVALLAELPGARRPAGQVLQERAERLQGNGGGLAGRGHASAVGRVGDLAGQQVAHVSRQGPGGAERAAHDERMGHRRLQVGAPVLQGPRGLLQAGDRRRGELGLGPQAVQEQAEQPVGDGVRVGQRVATPVGPVGQDQPPAEDGPDEVAIDRLGGREIRRGHVVQAGQPAHRRRVARLEGPCREVVQPLVIGGQAEAAGGHRIGLEFLVQERVDQRLKVGHGRLRSTGHAAGHGPYDSQLVNQPHDPSSEAIAAVARALRRIRRDEAAIGAFAIVAAEGARIDARAVDARGGSRPLRGTTVGVKDIIEVAGLPTRCGAPAVTDPSPALTDATVVARLRAAGSVVIGKTTTAAFAYFDPPPTHNPWDLRRTPGGSSAGSAAAVAAGMVDLALGTQTAGSLVRPASFCGLAAVLPSPGRIPRDGVRLLSPTFDRVGVMAATLDLALAAVDAASDGPRPVSPARPAAPRLGVAGWLLDEAEPPMRMAVEAAIEAARRAGATIVPVLAPRPLEAVLAAHATILRVEAAAIHGGALASVGPAYPPRLADLIRLGLATPATELAASATLPP